MLSVKELKRKQLDREAADQKPVQDYLKNFSTSADVFDLQGPVDEQSNSHILSFANAFKNKV